VKLKPEVRELYLIKSIEDLIPLFCKFYGEHLDKEKIEEHKCYFDTKNQYDFCRYLVIKKHNGMLK